MKPLFTIGSAPRAERLLIMNVLLPVSIGDINSNMYAVSLGSSVYHLMQPRSNRTVCGLKVRPIRVKLRTGLTSTPTQPLDKIVCKHCVRLTQPR